MWPTEYFYQNVRTSIYLSYVREYRLHPHIGGRHKMHSYDLRVLPLTCVNVVRCLRLAGVGHEAVVGVWPACWLNDDKPLPGDVIPPVTLGCPVLGSGFSFLNAPSAVNYKQTNPKISKLHTKCDYVMMSMMMMIVNVMVSTRRAIGASTYVCKYK